MPEEECHAADPRGFMSGGRDANHAFRSQRASADCQLDSSFLEQTAVCAS